MTTQHERDEARRGSVSNRVQLRLRRQTPEARAIMIDRMRDVLDGVDGIDDASRETVAVQLVNIAIDHGHKLRIARVTRTTNSLRQMAQEMDHWDMSINPPLGQWAELMQDASYLLEDYLADLEDES